MENLIQKTNYLRVEDIKKILKISRTTAYTLVNGGNFPVLKIGERNIRIPENTFYQWVENNISYENKKSNEHGFIEMSSSREVNTYGITHRA